MTVLLVYLFSFILCSFWFNDIASEAIKLEKILKYLMKILTLI